MEDSHQHRQSQSFTLSHPRGWLIPPCVWLQRGWEPRLSACYTPHVSCHQTQTVPEEFGGSRRDEEARISLGLAAELLSHHPPWVSSKQAQTGCSHQCGDESLSRPNSRVLLYPNLSSLLTAHRTPPAHQLPLQNLLTSFEPPCEGPPERLRPHHQASPIQSMSQRKGRTQLLETLVKAGPKPQC